jgi:hypothetical protein
VLAVCALYSVCAPDEIGWSAAVDVQQHPRQRSFPGWTFTGSILELDPE